MLKYLFTNYEGKAKIHAIFIIIFFFKNNSNKKRNKYKKNMKRITKINR